MLHDSTQSNLKVSVLSRRNPATTKNSSNGAYAHLKGVTSADILGHNTNKWSNVLLTSEKQLEDMKHGLLTRKHYLPLNNLPVLH